MHSAICWACAQEVMLAAVSSTQRSHDFCHQPFILTASSLLPGRVLGYCPPWCTTSMLLSSRSITKQPTPPGLHVRKQAQRFCMRATQASRVAPGLPQAALLVRLHLLLGPEACQWRTHLRMARIWTATELKWD